mmetsp:Transcript_1224/g.2839  ORF Transcript_1224/g.2839 Transcript_1224/m.2839 type:complete len:255 (-) Transcript_1224:156-920(-)
MAEVLVSRRKVVRDRDAIDSQLIAQLLHDCVLLAEHLAHVSELLRLLHASLKLVLGLVELGGEVHHALLLRLQLGPQRIDIGHVNNRLWRRRVSERAELGFEPRDLRAEHSIGVAGAGRLARERLVLRSQRVHLGTHVRLLLQDAGALDLQLLELVQELLVRDFLLFKRLQKLRILRLPHWPQRRRGSPLAGRCARPELRYSASARKSALPLPHKLEELPVLSRRKIDVNVKVAFLRLLEQLLEQEHAGVHGFL